MTRTGFAWGSAATIAAITLGACGQEPVSLDLNGPPIAIAVAAGNNQVAVRGTTLPAELVVVVTDASGRPAPAVQVRWASSGGSVLPAVDSTTNAGESSATWTLPATPGDYVVTATVTGAGSAQFSAEATGANQVIILGGNNQAGTAGSTLSQSLRVSVVDAGGRPVPSATVVWAASGGSVTPAGATTNAEGEASAAWLLPGMVGDFQAQAMVIDVDTAGFTAEARPAGYPLVFRYLDAGSYHSCGITTDEELHCWGYNGDGQLGMDPGPPVPYPTLIQDVERFRLVTGGRYHSCGVTLSGEVDCWGENKDGRLGTAGPRTYQFAQAGYVHSCGLSLAREVRCWGYNVEGELGVGAPESPGFIQVDTLVGVGYKAVTVNGLHSCGLTEAGAAMCWGFGAEGQLGNGGTATMFLPTAVATATLFRTDPTVAPPAPDPSFPLPPGPFIAAGYAHTCALATGGETYCWGLNEDGQLGTGTTGSLLAPATAVAGGQTFARITAGHRHTCGITATGVAYCWGDNTHGQLGDGSTTDRLTPMPVAGGRRFAYLKAGELHTCGVTSVDDPGGPGVAYCWGDNEYGQLGDGTIGTLAGSPLPRKVRFQP